MCSTYIFGRTFKRLAKDFRNIVENLFEHFRIKEIDQNDVVTRCHI